MVCANQQNVHQPAIMTKLIIKGGRCMARYDGDPTVLKGDREIHNGELLKFIPRNVEIHAGFKCP